MWPSIWEGHGAVVLQHSPCCQEQLILKRGIESRCRHCTKLFSEQLSLLKIFQCTQQKVPQGPPMTSLKQVHAQSRHSSLIGIHLAQSLEPFLSMVYIRFCRAQPPRTMSHIKMCLQRVCACLLHLSGTLKPELKDHFYYVGLFCGPCHCTRKGRETFHPGLRK